MNLNDRPPIDSAAARRLNEILDLDIQTQGLKYKSTYLKSDADLIERLCRVTSEFDKQFDRETRVKLFNFAECEDNFEATFQYALHHLLSNAPRNTEKEKVLNEMVTSLFAQQKLLVSCKVAENLNFDLLEVLAVRDLHDLSSMPGLKRYRDLETLLIPNLNAIRANGLPVHLEDLLNQAIDCYNITVDQVNARSPILRDDAVDRAERDSVVNPNGPSTLFPMFQERLRGKNLNAAAIVCRLGSYLRTGLTVIKGTENSFFIYDQNRGKSAKLTAGEGHEEDHQGETYTIPYELGSKCNPFEMMQDGFDFPLYKFEEARIEIGISKNTKAKMKQKISNSIELSALFPFKGAISRAFEKNYTEYSYRRLIQMGVDRPRTADLDLLNGVNDFGMSG